MEIATFRNVSHTWNGTSEDSSMKSPYRNLQELFQDFYRSSSDVSYRIYSTIFFPEISSEICCRNSSFKYLLEETGFSIKNYSVDFVQKLLRVFPPENTWRISTRNSTWISLRNFFGVFLQSSLLRFAPRILPEIFSKNFSGAFLQKFLQGFSLGIPSEISRRNALRNSSVDFFQEFYQSINPKISFRNFSGFCSWNFFGDFFHKFFRGFAPGIYPCISSWNFSGNVPQELFRKFCPGIPQRISNSKFLRIFRPKILQGIPSVIVLELVRKNC